MGEIKPRDIQFGKTDEKKEKRPTDIIITNKHSLKECSFIFIIVSPGDKKPVPLKRLYYATSKKYHYFNLKKIEGWNRIKFMTFWRTYRGEDGRLRLSDFNLVVEFGQNGLIISNKKK
jgi:hypothetical protein